MDVNGIKAENTFGRGHIWQGKGILCVHPMPTFFSHRSQRKWLKFGIKLNAKFEIRFESLPKCPNCPTFLSHFSVTNLTLRGCNLANILSANTQKRAFTKEMCCHKERNETNWRTSSQTSLGNELIVRGKVKQMK